MRRVFVILVLLFMMAGLNTLKTSSAGASDPLTLAAIGFVVLAAFAVAELGARLSLPKVTGYIISGVALGPFAIDILSTAVVAELKMFSNLALGLIALTAGLELDLRGLARLARTLAATTAIKIVSGFGLVGGSLAIIAATTGLLGDLSTAESTSLALLFGALSLGTSPSIALAVSTESRAKGRLTELVLGASVVKDLVVVVFLAISISITKALLGGGSVDAHVFIHLGKDIGLSLLIGTVVGIFLILYMTWVRLEMLLVVAVVVLAVFEVGAGIQHTFHMEVEYLLVFIMAGAVVRNASHHEHALLDPLQKISLPIFIVFFTTAGADINLVATWTLLPVALTLCGMRAIGYFVAGRYGGRFGGEPPAIQRLAWLGYLPQAGVTLTLVKVATHQLGDLARAFPQLQSPAITSAEMDAFVAQVGTLGLAVVAVNLLIGPVTLRYALRAANEIPTEVPADEVEAQPSESPVPELESPALAAAVGGLAVAIHGSWETWRQQSLMPELKAWREAFRATPSSESAANVMAEVAKRLDRIPKLDAEGRRRTLQLTLLTQLEAIEKAPASVDVPLEDRHRKVLPRDNFSARSAKVLATIGAMLSARGSNRQRTVPLRIAARTAIEPAMATLAEESLRDLQRFEIHCLECMQRVTQGTFSWADGQRELDTLVEVTAAKVSENHRTSSVRAIANLTRAAANLGAPAQWRMRVRYSRVTPAIKDAINRLNADTKTWTERRSAAVRTLRFVTEVEHAESRLATALQRDVADALDEAFEGLVRLVEEERERIESLPLAAGIQTDEDWQRLGLRVRAILPKPAQRELRNVTTRVRRATSTSAPLSGVLSFVADGEASIRIMPSLHDMARSARPARTNPITVDVRELKEVQISGQLLPQIEQLLEEVTQALAAIREGMREAASLIEFGFEAADTGRAGHQADAAAKFDESRERAIAMLSTLRVGACRVWAEQRDALREDVSQMSNRLFAAIAAAGGGAVERSVGRDPLTQLHHAGRRAVDAVQERLRRAFELIRAGEAGQSADELALRYHLRTGGRRVDAQAIRSYLEDQVRARTSSIEGLYASLFTSDPLRDPRLFVANRDALNGVIKAARTWQGEPRAGNGALVLGGSGSGKSSILGIAQLKLGARRVLLIRRRAPDESSLLESLGRALGCSAELEVVLRALRGQRSVVVLDDAHHWLPPDERGLESLARLRELIAVTQETTFFLVSMSSEAYELWHRTMPIDQSFATVVRLRPVNAEVLDAVIAARHELSGLDIEFPTTLAARVAERVLGRPIRTSFVRTLAASAGGNLRRALALWLAHASAHEHRVTLRSIQALGWGLPFIHQLGPQAMATLAVLVRHGPQSEDDLGRFLGTAADDMAQLTRFLIASGLVAREQATRHLAPTARFIDDLIAALTEHGALSGGRS